MPDLCPLLTLLSLGYGAAAVGLLAALFTRALVYSRGRSLSTVEATWCAFLPLTSVLILPAVSLFQPGGFSALAVGHRLWHGWEQSLHAASAVHGFLHLANFLLLAFAGWAVARTVRAVIRLRACERALRSTARVQGASLDGLPVYLLPSSRPACFTWGLFKPAVYLSAGFQEQLRPRDCEAMFAHEAAHVRRRDGLIRLFFATCYSLLPLPGIRLLCAEWERAAERACDAEAARRLGSPHDVAAALIRVARLVSGSLTPASGAAPFAAVGDDIEGRVQALLALAAADAVPSVNRSSLLLFLVVSLGGILVANFWLPHAVELFVRH